MGTPKKTAGKAEPKKPAAAPAAKTEEASPPAPAPAAAAPAPAAAPAEPEPAPVQTTEGVFRLDRARALVELAAKENAKLVKTGIQSFKDADRRTMNVVVAGGKLYKQGV